MDKYTALLERTASTSLSVGSLVADPTTPRRFKIYEYELGSDNAAGDATLKWQIQRCTTAGTSTAVTPQKVDGAASAALTNAGANHSSDPTLTANAIVDNVPLNQRSTYRYQARPGDEIIDPATPSNGFA